ncbi:MAG: hypothetical protein ACOYLR_06195, partial [Chlorobium sp.]
AGTLCSGRGGTLYSGVLILSHSSIALRVKNTRSSLFRSFVSGADTKTHEVMSNGGKYFPESPDIIYKSK